MIILKSSSCAHVVDLQMAILFCVNGVAVIERSKGTCLAINLMSDLSAPKLPPIRIWHVENISSKACKQRPPEQGQRSEQRSLTRNSSSLLHVE